MTEDQEVPPRHRVGAVGQALSFLTVIPIGAPPPGPGGLVAFPLAGLVLGGLWAATGWAGTEVWGPAAGAAAVLTIDALATGGLHLDAVADTADGLAARRPPAETLAIMRDPGVGAAGATALGVVLLGRFGLLTALLEEPSGAILAVVPPVAGRAAMVWALGALPAGRRPPGGGGSAGEAPPAAQSPVEAASLSAGLTGVARWPVRLAAGALGLVLAGAVADVPGLLAGVLGPATAVGLAGWWSRRIGLASGDAAGAAGLVGETAALAVLAA